MARVRPERRRPIDLAITAVVVVLVLAVGLIAWSTSPARNTISEQASAAPPAVDAVSSVPGKLVSRWQADSGATAAPAVGKATVVTGDGGTVIGHDPATGRRLWTYSRDQDLCTVDTAWTSSSDRAVAVYRNSRGCSEVTSLDAATGARRGARTSDADDRLQISSDSGYVVAQGPRRLETWGSNLVRGIEYGRVEAPVRPDAQPERTDCEFFSSAIAGERLALIEHCGDEPGYRLTVLRAVLDDDERVEQFGSTIMTGDTDGPPPVLIAMSSTGIAVYDGGANPAEPFTPGAPQGPTIRRFTTDGVAAGSNSVAGEAAPPSGSVPIAGSGVVSFWTGRATVVLDSQSLRPIYQVPGTLGPGTEMAGQLLVPSTAGLSVRDLATGRESRSIPLTRSGPVDGVVIPRTIGDIVVEQRGRVVEAFGPPV